MPKQSRKHFLWHGFLIGGNRETAFGNMESALCGSPIRSWIMKHSLCDAVTGNQWGFEFILIRRQGKLAGQAMEVHV